MVAFRRGGEGEELGHRKREGGEQEKGRQTSYFQLQGDIYWLYLPIELMLWLYAT